jgi:hypothetical protein
LNDFRKRLETALESHELAASPGSRSLTYGRCRELHDERRPMA